MSITHDPAYDADLDIAEEEAVSVIAEHVENERLASATWIEDALSDLTHEDYKAIAGALSVRNRFLAGVLLMVSVTRIIKADAQMEARCRFDRLCREEEEEAALERMEAER